MPRPWFPHPRSSRPSLNARAHERRETSLAPRSYRVPPQFLSRYGVIAALLTDQLRNKVLVETSGEDAYRVGPIITRGFPVAPCTAPSVSFRGIAWQKSVAQTRAVELPESRIPLVHGPVHASHGCSSHRGKCRPHSGYSFQGVGHRVRDSPILRVGL